VAAVVADVEVSAEGLGPAALDRAHDVALLAGQRVRVAIAVTVGAKDLGDLE
jgi:hypothetical protein